MDTLDSHWGEFKIWQDLDLGGQSYASELKTPAELGITSFDLNGNSYVPADGEESSDKDNVVSATCSFDNAACSVLRIVSTIRSAG